MRHFLRLCFIVFALPATAETLTSDDGRVASVIQLSDALGAYPIFAEFLRDEALAIREDTQLTAAEDGEKGIILEISDTVTVAAPVFVSVLRVITQRTGKIGFKTVEALTWDAPLGEFARLDRFFTDGQPEDDALIAIAFRLKEGIAENIWKGKVAPEWSGMVEQATSPDLAVLSNFTLAPGTAPGKAAGLTFHFSPKEISPEGRPQALTVPLTLFAQWLNADGRALFGGSLTP